MNIITSENVIEWLKQEDSFLLQPCFEDEKFWLLAKPLCIQLSNGRIIRIPKGFRTDLSSVPQSLWFLFSPYGDFNFAALIHDWLYISKPFGFGAAQRKFADEEMFYWSKLLNKNGSNICRFLAVRWFGWIVWKKGIKNKSHLRYLPK
jgi:hypothetical protein